jgi:hypothetical protein
MGHKIRRAMMQREGRYRLKGNVEVDQLTVGTQKHENRLKIREDRHTKFLMGVQEGVTKNYPRFVTFEQLESLFKEGVLSALEKRIAQGSHLKSDAGGTFVQAAKQGYTADAIPMKTRPQEAKEHLKWIHHLSTNLKRGLVSTYHGCFPKYRKAYLAEFAYRFNRRYWPYQAFDRLLFACLNAPPNTLRQIKA